MAHDKNGKWIGLGFDEATGLPDTGASVAKIQHRLLKAYAANSHAVAHGVRESAIWDNATRDSLIDLMTYINRTEGKNYRADGIANRDVQIRIGSYVPPVLGPKYEIQGVSYDTTAYLMPPTAHSFNKATQQGAEEGLRLTLLRPPGRKIIGLGYSMGAKTLRDYEMMLPVERRKDYVMSVNFGDPSMRPDGSLLGNPAGEGISKQPHPDWVADRYYSYSLDGDWYPRARGLLFFLYDVISRAELTLDFAMWLLTQFPTKAMQELTGIAPSTDNTGAAGLLAPLAGFLTTGPTSIIPASPLGNLINPLQLFTLLPQLIELLTDALKFATTNAHGMYNDPAHAVFDGLTGVDHAVRTIKKRVPEGALLLLFPGSWANWDQGFDADTAFALQ